MKKRKIKIIQPNLDWYKKISSRYKLPSRCPYRTINNCPRYYLSISLLGEKGITARLDKKEFKKCYKIWEKSELWPIRREETPSIMGTETSKIYRNFCPEVTFEMFGIFATNLSEYADELDRNIAHKELAKIKSGKDDWRWYWFSIAPQHYTDCPLYLSLVIQADYGKKEVIMKKLTPKQRKDYELFRYKSYSKIEIIGKECGDRKNIIKIDKKLVKLSDANFKLFLRLVSALRQGKEGWINVKQLVGDEKDEFYNLDIYKYLYRLRDELSSYIGEEEVNKLIQKGTKYLFRISTHPDFIKCDRKKLLNHQNPQISKLAKKLL